MQRMRAGAAMGAALLALATASCASEAGSGAAARSQPTSKIVSYHGVQIQVPRSWPVSDGVHALACLTPFPATPTVFLGSPRDSPSCPASSHPVVPARDGIWLQPADRPIDAQPRRLATGQPVLVLPNQERATAFWYNGVQVTIGLGADPGTAAAIEASLAYRPGARDTRAPDSCGTSSHPDVMPTPERLAQPLVLNHGDDVLDPPRASDQATISAAAVWAASGPKSRFAAYRLILARYSAAFPARANADGSVTALIHDALTWIVYSTSVRPNVTGCGGGGLSAFDARTNAQLTSTGWSPGP